MGSAVVDMVFPVAGRKLPWDHSYALYGALCRQVPALHAGLTAGVFPINGAPAGGGQLKLSESSRLRIRVAPESVCRLLPLAHAEFDLEGYEFGLGAPTLEEVRPKPALFSPWVTFKGYLTPQPFLDRVETELRSREIEASFGLVRPRSSASREGKRGSLTDFVSRTRTIKGARIVGFALLIQGLSVEASLDLSQRGLGGRRRMGGGLFMPARQR